jgi:hypothetical protein
VTRQTLNNLVNGKSGISADMAIRLDKAFGGGAGNLAAAANGLRPRTSPPARSRHQRQAGVPAQAARTAPVKAQWATGKTSTGSPLKRAVLGRAANHGRPTKRLGSKVLVGAPSRSRLRP